jgi:hypothetical protein
MVDIVSSNDATPAERYHLFNIFDRQIPFVFCMFDGQMTSK